MISVKSIKSAIQNPCIMPVTTDAWCSKKVAIYFFSIFGLEVVLDLVLCCV
jgi:hypothetical protein